MTQADPPPGPERGSVDRGFDKVVAVRDRAERYLRRNVAWNRLFGVVSYLRSALWLVPFVAILLVLLMAPVLRVLDRSLGWGMSGLRPAGAQALYQTVITLTLSFLVFTFGSLLVAIQVASGQLTPRIIATTLLRDNVVRFSVGLFTFSMLFAVSALNRLEETVHQIVALLTAILGLASIAMFLFLIDYAARLLRPVSIVARVGDEGLTVIKTVYPRSTGDGAGRGAGAPAWPRDPRRTVRYAGSSAILLAVDVATLVAKATHTDGVIELVPQVGDFVATGEPLFVLHGGAAALDDRRLQDSVALGVERTMEQDPLFAFRILVDIALKALSPAINDPTTAVLAMDQVHRLLRVVGQRHLRGEIVRDHQDAARVIVRTPNWEDFVNVAFCEIRACGGNSIQITRRQRATLENLLMALPPHRHDALRRELRLLERAVEQHFANPEDRALASVPDSQGLGGASGTNEELET